MSKKNNIFIIYVFAVLIVIFNVILLSLIMQKTVKALQYNSTDTVLSWINKGTIEVKRYGETALFVDSNPSDNKKEFLFSDKCGSHKIIVSSNNGISSITYSTWGMNDLNALVDNVKPPEGKKCSTPQTANSVSIKNTDNANKPVGTVDPPDNSVENPYKNSTFAWVNGGQIQASGGPGGMFTATKDVTSIFTSNTFTGDEKKCYNKITNISSNYKTAMVIIAITKSAAGGEVCDESVKYKINLKDVENQQKTPVYTTEQEPAEEGRSCYSAMPIVGFILCPLLDIADGIYGFALGVVQDLLRVDKNFYDNDSGSLKIAWANVKNVATAAIVLIALVIIASQIFNFEFLSAYTIKKALPRLVIAVVAIQLSWFIFTGLIQLTNAVGDGIYSLLMAPFSGNGTEGTDVLDLIGVQSENSTGVIFGGVLAGGLLVASAGFAMGASAFLTLIAAGVIVAIIVVIFTLVIRKLLIVVLLVLAPIALVAWILPGTQKFWNMWWGLFSKLLLMFPLIMILFAAGKIGAIIIAGASEDDQIQGGINTVLLIIAYFAPLFLIPSTFKFAGGIFSMASSKISGLGNKWGKKAGSAADASIKGGVGRLARNNNNRWTRGLNYAAHGAFTPRTQSRADSMARKSLDDLDQQEAAHIDQLISGESHDRQVEILRGLASNEGARGDAAIRALASMDEFGSNGVGNEDIDIGRLHRLARRDKQFAAQLWGKRRDLAEGGMQTIAGMSATQLAGLNDDAWANIGFDERGNRRTPEEFLRSTVRRNANESDADYAARSDQFAQQNAPIFRQKLRVIQDSEHLNSTLKANATDYISSYADGGNPGGSPADGGNPGGAPAGGGNPGGAPAGGTQSRARRWTNPSAPAPASTVLNDLSTFGNGSVQSGVRSLTPEELDEAWNHARSQKWHKDRGGATTIAERQAAAEIAAEMVRRGRM